MPNEIGKLRRIALRRPSEAFVDQDNIANQWRELNYHAQPDFADALLEYEHLERIIASTGCEILALGHASDLGLDSIYIRDSLIVTPDGLVETAMGKRQRNCEPTHNASMLQTQGEVIAGKIDPPGKVEGGDLVWLDDSTLLAGVGYRTNDHGLDQLQEIIGHTVTLHRFDLPHYKGADDVFHLMSVLSPVDYRLAVVYPALMPVRLMHFLKDAIFDLVEVPDEEFASMACNVLAISPRHVIMVDGNPKTAELLKNQNCRVEIIKADEISRKGEGGPTCLTRPLERE